MGKIVDSGYVQVPYAIFEHEVDGELRYDWYDSAELYDTPEEAKRAFMDTHGAW